MRKGIQNSKPIGNHTIFSISNGHVESLNPGWHIRLAYTSMTFILDVMIKEFYNWSEHNIFCTIFVSCTDFVLFSYLVQSICDISQPYKRSPLFTSIVHDRVGLVAQRLTNTFLCEAFGQYWWDLLTAMNRGRYSAYYNNCIINWITHELLICASKLSTNILRFCCILLGTCGKNISPT